nr:hypothetical protein GCM10020063_029480 [Dactylosporangium thailandense]
MDDDAGLGGAGQADDREQKAGEDCAGAAERHVYLRDGCRCVGTMLAAIPARAPEQAVLIMTAVLLRDTMSRIGM